MRLIVEEESIFCVIELEKGKATTKIQKKGNLKHVVKINNDA